MVLNITIIADIKASMNHRMIAIVLVFPNVSDTIIAAKRINNGDKVSAIKLEFFVNVLINFCIFSSSFYFL